MNTRTRIATAATVSLFALSMVFGVSAQSTVTQQIGAGGLTAAFNNAVFPLVPFSNVARINVGTLTLNVVDARGNNAGWSVSVDSTDFFSAGDATDIQSSGFRYGDTQPPVEANSGSPTGVSNAGAAGSLEYTHVPLSATAPNGTGDYTAVFNVTLDIPAQQAVDTYVSTLTVTTMAGPSS